MAEENQNTEQTAAPAAQPEYTEVEQRAMAQGWVPQDQYEGTQKWRDAEEFLDRGELFAKIDENGRRAKNAERMAEDLKKHLETVRKTEYNKALAALKAEKIAALEESNAAKVVEIDEQIAETKESFRTEAVSQNQVQNDPNPAFMIWVNRNQWYQNDTAMRLYADETGRKLAAAGETHPSKILEEVERQVKKEFSHKFNNPNRSKAGTVEGGTSKGSTSKEQFQMSDDERRAMKRFVAAGVLTEAEYIKDLKEARGD